ncbi:hypothetical protein Q0812_07380 [Brevundimonas sp. 2R-24]|uniref:DUF2267 domain-containing protein n=1 Tax=Peiella sedimenti TaxID=3061083 RepID=A0ABT8SLJ0_9CAUL|nr:hypothetical protein [Caulobacteraceae bacterium XZ-24]
MDEDLISYAAREAGVSDAEARAALAGLAGLIARHAEPGRVKDLFAARPQVEALARSPEAAPKKAGGLFGGVMRSAGGVSGRAMSEAMGLMQALEKQGVGKDALKRLARAAEAWSRQQPGEEPLRPALESIPGVGGLIAGR